MSEEIQNITTHNPFSHEFNATVKKGSLFEIDYVENFETHQEIEVISGKATVVEDAERKEWRKDWLERKKVFRADQADKNGNIEIAVTDVDRGHVNPPNIYKIHVV